MLIPRRTIQRRAPFTSAPKWSVAATRDDAQHERKKREPPDMARRQKRCREHDGDCGNDIEHVPGDEIERIKAEAGGNRRACGE